METCFTSEKICENTWMIFGSGCTSYLLVGDDFGVMIDTGYAKENLHDYVMTLTDKPVEIVLNTHGHFDHTGGNGFFKCALMGRLAAKIAKVTNGYETPDPAYPLDYPIVIIDDGFKIDLGNRVIETFKIGGHSPDSLAFLDHGQRILFGGDAIGVMVQMRWKCPDPQPSVINFVENFSKIMAHRSEFDYTCPGHGTELYDASAVDYCMIAALRALNGELDEHQRPKNVPERKGPSPFAKHDPSWGGFTKYGNSSFSFDKRYIWDTTDYDVVIGT